jgi:hypothetical protein
MPRLRVQDARETDHLTVKLAKSVFRNRSILKKPPLKILAPLREYPKGQYDALLRNPGEDSFDLSGDQSPAVERNCQHGKENPATARVG